MDCGVSTLPPHATGANPSPQQGSCIRHDSEVVNGNAIRTATVVDSSACVISLTSMPSMLLSIPRNVGPEVPPIPRCPSLDCGKVVPYIDSWSNAGIVVLSYYNPKFYKDLKTPMFKRLSSTCTPRGTRKLGYHIVTERPRCRDITSSVDWPRDLPPMPPLLP